MTLPLDLSHKRSCASHFQLLSCSKSPPPPVPSLPRRVHNVFPPNRCPQYDPRAVEPNPELHLLLRRLWYLNNLPFQPLALNLTYSCFADGAPPHITTYSRSELLAIASSPQLRLPAQTTIASLKAFPEIMLGPGKSAKRNWKSRTWAGRTTRWPRQARAAPSDSTSKA